MFHHNIPLEWIQREARVGRLVNDAGLASPEVEGVIEDEGRHGIIFERVDGATMLAEISSKPWTLRRSARTLADLHASMHGKSFADLPSQRQHLLDSIRTAGSLDDRQKEAIINRIDKLPGGAALCHGDYHPDNVILSKRGAVTIDWTTATKGNPLADVARTSLLLQLGELPPDTPALTRIVVRFGRTLFHRVYLRRYFQIRPATQEQLVDWQLPIIAARLGDGIVEEREQLLSLIESHLGG